MGLQRIGYGKAVGYRNRRVRDQTPGRALAVSPCAGVSFLRAKLEAGGIPVEGTDRDLGCGSCPKPAAMNIVLFRMESNYIPVAGGFRQTVEALVSQRKSVHINYVTDLRELLSATAIIKALHTKNQAEFAVLSNGEEIRLDRLVRVAHVPAPGYEGYDFGNSCAL